MFRMPPYHGGPITPKAMNKKHLLIALAITLATLPTGAQSLKDDLKQNTHLGGYVIAKGNATTRDDAEKKADMGLRLVRLYIDSRLGDFAMKLQMQVNGNTSTLGSSPRVVDAFAEWQKYDAVRIKAGQFKRPFTFENPMHPITQGFMNYSQPVSKLAGFSDRTGEQPSNGRDIGLQVQGDVLPICGRNWLHYQIGVFNGEGINRKDADNRKDVIGGLWLMPVDGMRLGVFGWTGSRDGVGNKDRYAVSADYQKNDYTFRAEYIHSKGFGTDVRDGNEADGFYVLGIVPVVKDKLHAKARYDVYRNEASWGIRKVNYEVGLDYHLTKNLQLNVEYARVNEHTRNYDALTIGRFTYNLVDVQLDFKF